MIGRVSRRGFSLLEVLVVMWTLGIILSFGAVLLLACMRVDYMTAGELHRISRHNLLADEFRADVAASLDAPAAIGNYAGGPACLILRQPGDIHVIYRWQNNVLERIVHTGNAEQRRQIHPGPAKARVEFDRQPGERQLVILRVINTAVNRSAAHTEIAAALGADLR